MRLGLGGGPADRPETQPMYLRGHQHGLEEKVGGVRQNFSHQHHYDSIVILEEGDKPQPRCPQCDMFVPQ